MIKLRIGRSSGVYNVTQGRPAKTARLEKNGAFKSLAGEARSGIASLDLEKSEKVASSAYSGQSIFRDYIHVKYNVKQPTPNHIYRWCREDASPYLQLAWDHDQWKAKQPEVTLPDSKGMTEENMAFLRERYPGELTAVEMYDLTQTLRDLEIMSREEYNAAYGTHKIIMTVPEPVNGRYQDTVGPVEEPIYHEHDLSAAAIVDCRTLDDIMNWLESYRANGREDPPTLTAERATVQTRQTIADRLSSTELYRLQHPESAAVLVDKVKDTLLSSMLSEA